MSLSQMRQHQIKKQLKGLCPHCDSSLATSEEGKTLSRCPSCLVKNRERMRKSGGHVRRNFGAASYNVENENEL